MTSLRRMRGSAQECAQSFTAPPHALALAVVFCAALCWTPAPAAADAAATGAAAEKDPAAKPPPPPKENAPEAGTQPAQPARPAPEPARIVPSEEIEVETPVAFPADI